MALEDGVGISSLEVPVPSNHPNRIESLSVTASVPRQTPENEFGPVLARTLGEAASRGSGLIGSVAGFSPVASAAVSAVRGVTSITGVGGPAGGAMPVPGGTGTSGSGSGSGSTQDLLQQVATGGDGSS